MQFSKGQTIVHPHHGPATIRTISSRKVSGVSTKYLNLDVQNSTLTVSVPLDKAQDIGLRDVFTAAQLDEVFAVLRAPSGAEEKQWSRRIKKNAETIKNGDMLQIAEVVRDLVRRADESNLSYAEKQMLRDARSPLVTEISLTRSISLDKADALLDSEIRGETAESATVTELPAKKEQLLAG